MIPEAWAEEFEAAGGILALNADGSLWLGVISARPDCGARAVEMKLELSGFPDKLLEVELLVRERLRR